MFEFKNNYNKNLKSIFISKFCFKCSKSIFKFKINYYFILKKKKVIKVYFFFILLLIIVGEFPKIIKLKKNKLKQNEFLAFEYDINFLNLFKFINIYWPIADIVESLYFKFNYQEYRLTIKYFPILNEVDRICESNINFLEFIQDYKFLLKFKLFNSDWYFFESLIRSLNIPLLSKNRT